MLDAEVVPIVRAVAVVIRKPIRILLATIWREILLQELDHVIDAALREADGRPGRMTADVQMPDRPIRNRHVEPPEVVDVERDGTRHQLLRREEIQLKPGGRTRRNLLSNFFRECGGVRRVEIQRFSGADVPDVDPRGGDGGFRDDGFDPSGFACGPASRPRERDPREKENEI